MANELRGTIAYLGEVEQVTDTFVKRTFVLRTNEQYSQEIKLQVTQKNINLLNRCNVGNLVTAQYNLRGKPYQRKDGSTDWNLNLDVWKIDNHDEHQNTPQEQPQQHFDDVPF